MIDYLKGRGAQINPDNPFHEFLRAKDPRVFVDPEDPTVRTKYIQTHAKTILNKVESPDIGMAWSMNPYQGCEHGCVYCYARNTHTYWGYSAGLDFETNILVKKNAPALLAKKLRSRKWKPMPIMLSGNTDCYQPIEQKLKITRQILEVLWQFRHPVGIITKSHLVTRDLDILQQMAAHDLVKVAVSINTLNEDLRLKLEPRTASAKKRLDTVQQLSSAGIPVNVMVAPIIPGLNEHEAFEIVQAASEAGASGAYHILVRLNGDVYEIFNDWVRTNFPDRADKVINKIKSTHGGKVNDSRFGVRMRGEGAIAESIANQMAMARKLYLKDRKTPDYNLDLYPQFRDPQMSLF